MAKIDKLLEHLESNAKSCKETLDAGAEAMKKDPAHALRWAEPWFDLAAMYSEFSYLAASIRKRKEEGDTNSQDLWIAVKDWVYKIMIAGNNVHHRSTSPCSNMYEDAKAMIMTRLYDMMVEEWRWED